MRLTGSRAYYRPTPPKMPSGLVELIQDLSREVLKNNPTDIYAFCASHVQQQLEIRDGPLQKKQLSLEEKIARAQKKVRQRAEKRRQQHDNDLLLRQQSREGPDINATASKDYTPSLPSQEPSAVNTLKTLNQHEQELVNSSEVEVSNDLDTGINTRSEHFQFENIAEEAIKYNDDSENVMNINDAVVAHESKNNINMMNSTNETNDENIITQDVSLNNIPKAENNVTNVNEDMLEKEILVDKINSILHESMAGEQIAHGGDQSSTKNYEFGTAVSGLQEEVDTKQHISNPVNSMIVDKGCVDDSTEQIIEESVEMEAKNTAYNESNEQNILTQTNDVAESPSDELNLSNKIEETGQSNDTQSIQQSIDSDFNNRSTMVEGIELTNNGNNIVNEDTNETNTNDTSKESPTMELQDPLIDSDMMESLLKTNTDSDIVTLMTQKSTNNELKEHDDHDSSNAMESYTITELPQVYKDNSESNMAISSHDEFHLNAQHENENNTIDLIENSIDATNENDKNGINDVNNSEHDTSTKLSESPPISNQDSSSMNLETAAITIQKVFRTFLFKSRASTFDDGVNDETIFLNEDDKNKEECNFPIAGSLNERRPHGITRMDTVLQTVNEEKSLSLSTDDSSTLSSAATVIQAHVRGFLVRNKLNSNKTISTNSLAASNSNEPSLTSLEMDNDQNKNKTVLNIHIVPEGGNYLSRDESLITSMDLSLDSSPPSSINLHPLGYDKSERRKQLKREDAIQSISPPSNQSGKLSEDIDSVKELPLNDDNSGKNDLHEGTSEENVKIAYVENSTLETIVNLNEIPVDIENDTNNQDSKIKQKRKSLTKMSSDEMDVVSPFITNEDVNSSDIKLMHSGEFHDAVLPTKVSRSDTSVASGE